MRHLMSETRRRKRIHSVAGNIAILLIFPLLTLSSLPVLSEQSSAHTSARYGNLPLIFEPNRGQTDIQVKFLSHGGGYTLFLTSDEAILASQAAAEESLGPEKRLRTIPEKNSALRFQLLGANSAAEIVGEGQLPGKSNYFLGHDPSRWRTGIAQYSRVRYRGVYPGVDLVYYGNQGKLEYDFIIRAQADVQNVGFLVKGSKQIKVEASGDLVIRMEDRDMTDPNLPARAALEETGSLSRGFRTEKAGIGQLCSPGQESHRLQSWSL